MFIVMIASECAPVSKVGGLADVVYGLSRELEIRDNAVEILLPKYDCMRYDQWLVMEQHLRSLYTIEKDFYMGILPGFFDLTAITAWDVVAICFLSALVPLVGNLALGLFIGQVRAVLSSPVARARLNLSAGVMMILVGLAIAVL